MERETIKRIQENHPEIHTICALALSYVQRKDNEHDPFAGTPHSVAAMAEKSGGEWSYVWWQTAPGAPTTTLVNHEGVIMIFNNQTGDVTIVRDEQPEALCIEALDQYLTDYHIAWNGWAEKRGPAEIVNVASVRARRTQQREDVEEQ